MTAVLTLTLWPWKLVLLQLLLNILSKSRRRWPYCREKQIDRRKNMNCRWRWREKDRKKDKQKLLSVYRGHSGATGNLAIYLKNFSLVKCSLSNLQFQNPSFISSCFLRTCFLLSAEHLIKGSHWPKYETAKYEGLGFGAVLSLYIITHRKGYQLFLFLAVSLTGWHIYPLEYSWSYLYSSLILTNGDVPFQRMSSESAWHKEYP